MEFLSSAILSSEDQALLGLRIVSFDPEDYVGRAKVILKSIDDLRIDYASMTPRGFRFEAPGNLYSDTSVDKTVADSVFPFVETESKKLGTRVPDITDFVLLGVQENGYIVANYNEVLDASEVLTSTEQLWQEEAILVPFKQFRVSNSSFNIYSSYRKKNGEFRTCSLLNVEDGSALELYAAFPSSVDLSLFGSACVACNAFERSEWPYTVYKVNLGLTGFYAEVGEAFLNYLAYNVSFYNIGEKLMKELVVDLPKPALTTVEEPLSRTARKAKINVSIEHCYKESRLQCIQQFVTRPQELEAYLQANPDAWVSMQWLQKIYNSPWYSGSDGTESEEELLFLTCTNLLSECKRERLKFALELLTHRYYISLLGMSGDYTGTILKGGGVDGESIKRFSFR